MIEVQTSVRIQCTGNVTVEYIHRSSRPSAESGLTVCCDDGLSGMTAKGACQEGLGDSGKTRSGGGKGLFSSLLYSTSRPGRLERCTVTRLAEPVVNMI